MSNEATETRIPEITLGWRLRMSMDHAGIKAEQMAAEFEVHRGTITRWTHDKGAPPRRRDLRDWAELCGVPFEWLVGDLFQDPTAEADLPKPRRPRSGIRQDRPVVTDDYLASPRARRSQSVINHPLNLVTI